MSLARRLAASLRRAVAFFTGYARVGLVVVAGLVVAGIVLASGLARLLMAAASVLGTALIIYAGSRAHATQHDRSPIREQTEANSHPQPGTAGTDGPLVTVVVTSHNDARFVSACLDSIRLQTWASWECIVVDDASTDGTVDTAFEAARGDERFEVIAFPAAVGVSMARNRGLDAASGEYVTFLDADDYLFVESLQRRALALSDRRSRPGVVGVYCDWVGVPELAKRLPRGRPPIRRDRITWFNSADGAPVINSAPLLLTSEVRKIGGYQDSWAEDADLWNRLMRHGYVLDPVLDNGIAYRQKASSRFRTSAPRHAEAMNSISESNRHPIDPGAYVPGTPYVYEHDVDSYRLLLARLNRHIIGLVTAHANQDQMHSANLLGRIVEEWTPYAWMAIDVETSVSSAALRHEAYDESGRRDRAAATTRAVVAALEERLDRPPWAPWPGSPTPLTEPLSGRHVRARTRDTLVEDDLSDIVQDAIVLMPAVRYHVDEMGPLADELSRRGRKVVFAVSDRRWPEVEAALRIVDQPIVACADPGPWVGAAAGLITLNDWGELYRDIVVDAQTRGVPTFAKVEGAQDWDDVDVHWVRNAYQTVDHVLCQGRNDESALDGRRTHVVGSTRLEAIWNQPARRAGPDLAILNSNFTYGVLSGAREDWLEAAVSACEDSGIDHTISMHPSERPDITETPMRHLLTTASVLISRFSTVPLEAMARGVPFVYFNPHGERVPTFQRPDGAFDVAASVSELSEALTSARSWKETYRGRCRKFFLQQIDVDASRSAAMRSADVIESICFP